MVDHTSVFTGLTIESPSHDALFNIDLAKPKSGANHRYCYHHLQEILFADQVVSTKLTKIKTEKFQLPFKSEICFIYHT